MVSVFAFCYQGPPGPPGPGGPVGQPGPAVSNIIATKCCFYFFIYVHLNLWHHFFHSSMNSWGLGG